MHIFIHKVHLYVSKPAKLEAEETYPMVIDLKFTLFQQNLLTENCLLKNPSQNNIGEIIELLINEKIDLKNINISAENRDELKKFIKSKFHIISAGGGIVQKNKKILLIYRLQKWDLPKGKMELGEDFPTTAHREVEEETGIKVNLEERIASTWHYYNNGKFRHLKQTKWFRMTCIDDSTLKPQTEEDIQEAKWMSEKNLKDAMKNSYPAIQHVIKKFQNKFPLK